MPFSRINRFLPLRVWRIGITDKDSLIVNWLNPNHRVKETVIKWTIVPWVAVNGINIKIVSPTANPKHTGLRARTLQLALPEAESFPNITSHTLGTMSGVLQPLLSFERWRRSEILVSAQSDPATANSSRLTWRPQLLAVPPVKPGPGFDSIIPQTNSKYKQHNFTKTHTRKRNCRRKYPPGRAALLGNAE